MAYTGSYISHHGILGQRWGVRRFQNKDGSLTAEGRKRYGVPEHEGLEKSLGGKSANADSSVRITSEDRYRYRKEKIDNKPYKKKIEKEQRKGKEISQRRKDLEELYKKKGMSEEDAKVEAFKREKAEKFIKGIAVVAVAAAATYAGYKAARYIQGKSDYKISAGTVIQRIVKDPDEPENRAGYVSFEKTDKMMYRGMYGKQLKDSGWFGPQKVYNVETTANKDMKIAGDSVAKKVFNQLMKNDPEFKKDNAASQEQWDSRGGDAAPGRKSEYEKFNTRLVGAPSEESLRIRTKFYGKLKDLGYDGVLDVNDKKYSGYHSKKPTILFNMGEGVGQRKVSELDSDEIEKEYVKAGARVLGLIGAESLAKKAPIISLGAAAMALLSKKNIEDRDIKEIPKEQERRKKIINQYKKDHPGTQLSDKEILDMQLG